MDFSLKHGRPALLLSIFATSLSALSPPPEDYAPPAGTVVSFALNETSCYVSLKTSHHAPPVTLRADRKACRDEIKGMAVALSYAMRANPDCKDKQPCKFNRVIRMIDAMEPLTAPPTADVSAPAPEWPEG